MGTIMTKQESLNILESVYKRINSMSDEELFKYMLKNSETFRKDIEATEKEDINIGKDFEYIEGDSKLENFIDMSINDITDFFEIEENDYKENDRWIPP